MGNDSFGFAQDKLRSLPALIKASLRNEIGLFLFARVVAEQSRFLLSRFARASE
jgi:hypothetical protein